MPASPTFTDADLCAFERDGYFIWRGLVTEADCSKMKQVADTHLAECLAPAEYEVDVCYPGAPNTLDSLGGETVRRLLHAFSRHPVFRDWATSKVLRNLLVQLFADDAVQLSQSHHNCIMTKRPGYSSATLWHQDNRYWDFDQQNLISVWLALGDEQIKNGCLRVIPGSHKMNFESGRFDANLFLRTDLAENKALIGKFVRVALNKGDVLFFHSKLFHAAGRNLTNETKTSLVFTYHEMKNSPIHGTRSARYPSISI
ncbi:MAG: phytanoyl-CoA dioxygenase family protein [Pseudomonadales bacterium]|nr:phytanoyl-CoA dioxygenase family protein [Pseudomonadales bacterium]